MDDTEVVGERQARTQLLDHLSRRVRCEGAAPHHRLQALPAGQPADQVGGIGLPPVVVQRDDVGVLEPSDQLGVSFEAADELGVVGQIGIDHLDRHLASRSRLVGAIVDPRAVPGEPLTQLVSPDRQSNLRGVGGRLQVEGRVGNDDTFLQALQRGGRFDAQFLTEMRPQPPERPKRLGLAARAVQRHHQLLGEPLPQRVLAGQALQLADQLRSQTAPQIGVDAQLHRLEPQLIEPPDLGLGVRLVHDVAVGPSPPQA